MGWDVSYSGEIGEGGIAILPWDRGGVVWPDMLPWIIAGGLLVGPAIGVVGELVRANVTTKLWPSHPFVDKRSVYRVRKTKHAYRGS